MRLFDNATEMSSVGPTRDVSPTMSRLVIADLAPNEERSYVFELPEATIGEHVGYAFLDPTLEVPDVDRSNNVFGPVISSLEGIVINEVFYDPIGMDDPAITGSGAFVELYTTAARDLSGFKLERYRADATLAETYTIPANTSAGPNGFLVLVDGAPTGTNAITVGSIVNGGNDGGALRLVDASGNALDAVAWGTAGDAGVTPFRGETTASFDVREGYSLGRNSVGLDVDNNLSDFFVWRIPTPGALNRVSLTNNADTCADAYLLSDGQQGKFLIEANLGLASNTYSAVDQTQPGCDFSQVSRAGHDQIFSFVVPPGRTASVELNLTEKADIEIDGVLSSSPCENIATSTIGCNPSGTSSFGSLAAGTYYLIVLEDGPISLASMNESYTYVVQIELN